MIIISLSNRHQDDCTSTSAASTKQTMSTDVFTAALAETLSAASSAAEVDHCIAKLTAASIPKQVTYVFMSSARAIVFQK